MSDAAIPESQPWLRLKRLPADLWGAGVIVALTILLAWHLASYDLWLTQLDIINQFMLWFGYLGRALASGRIPAWSPNLSGGAPFAGDPQSGWMYAPAMLLFPLFNAISAFKLLIELELLICGLTTYAYARVMKLGVAGSLTAAIVFEFSPFVNNPAYCCTNRIQIWTWLPMTLLGVELTLRNPDWRRKVAPICLTAFGLSQMYAGWIGQGMVYGLMVFGSYLLYRTFLPWPGHGKPLRDRAIEGAIAGFGSLAVSAGIGAAGWLPRLAVTHETMVGQGNYDDLTGALIPSPTLKKLLLNIAGSDNAPRGIAVGGVAFVLLFLAPFLAKKGYASVYFACLTVASYMLMLHTSPIHWILDLIPKFRTIHQHNTINVSAIGTIGPAMLAGAAVQSLPRLTGLRQRRWLLAAPLGALAAILGILGPHGLVDAGIEQAAALLTTAILLIATFRSRFAERWAPVLIVAVAFVVPTGAEIASARIGSPIPSPWNSLSSRSPSRSKQVRLMTETTAAGTDAAGFLQSQYPASPPFRFISISSVERALSNRDSPFVVALISNNRAISLDLNDISAYNPSQLSRYAKFINFLRGKTQNYHTTYLNVRAIQSPLLPLLNAPYLLLDRRLKPDNPDYMALTAGRTLVFEDGYVGVYKSDAPTSAAWIVHSVRRSSEAGVLKLMSSQTFDPRTKAIVEGGPFKISPLPAGSSESAVVTDYRPERVAVQADAASDGFLVLSEVYETGWSATIDGKPVQIRATDLAFRGVPLPAGKHEVVFTYHAKDLRLGLWISGATGTIVLLLLAWRCVEWFRMTEARRRED